MTFSISLSEPSPVDAQVGADTPRSCNVSGTLDFQTAGKALQSVSDLIHQHPSLVVDLSGVTSTNSSGLALLVAWRSLAESLEHSVSFHHIPDSLRQLADVCQVDGLI